MGDISIKGRSPILRQGYAVGGAVKGGIKAGKKFLDFIKTGKHVDKKGTKVNVPKAAERLTGKPHVDRVKKATGGWTLKEKLDFPGDRTGKPHSSREGRRGSWLRGAKRAVEAAKKIREKRRDRGRPSSPQPLAKGGKADKKWIQKATASIKRRGTKGKCTPITKKGCTGRAKALAKTFKKMAKKRKAA